MTKEEIFLVVKSKILEIQPTIAADAIRPGISLSDLGANSVDRMEVLTQSMEAVSASIPLMSFAGLSSIGEICEVLARHSRR